MLHKISLFLYWEYTLLKKKNNNICQIRIAAFQILKKNKTLKNFQADLVKYSLKKLEVLYAKLTKYTSIPSSAYNPRSQLTRYEICTSRWPD